MNDESEQRTPVVRAATDPEALEEALRILRAGGIVVLPTDTVYGVGCDPWSAEAIERLYEAKMRPHRLAIPVLLSAPEHAFRVARDLPDAFAPLVERFWPGGLTIIVPRHPALPPLLTAYGPTVALRMPDQTFALRLIEAMGGTLAVTSANISGQPAPATAQEALAQLKGRVDLVVDGGVCPGGVASTIVDITSSPPRILRLGVIPLSDLRKVLPELALPDEPEPTKGNSWPGRADPSAPAPGASAASMPSPLMPSEPGSFAERTIRLRKPSIIADVLQRNEYPSAVRQALEAFRQEILSRAPFTLLSEPAEDTNFWQQALAPWTGRSWFELPWFLAETYFYRRLLEIVGYFQPGPFYLRDPFESQKREALDEGLLMLERFLPSVPETAPLRERFFAWLQRSLWGNRADLSNIGTRDRIEGQERAAHILIDHRAQIWTRLAQGQVRRLDVATDNAGPELVADLGLIDFLLGYDQVQAVHLHLKGQPYFVSDAMLQDLDLTLAALQRAEEARIAALGKRLASFRDDGRLVCQTHPFWTSCLHFYQLPTDLAATLAQADLLLLKGDVNYRRLIGDAHWQPTERLEVIAAYMPAPFATLRTLKAEVVVGLDSGQAEAVARRDPDWLIDGEWAVIHLVDPLSANNPDERRRPA
ncbi:MAG: threonylcarbamoyl-AMP synthase [Chloroflexi bacterium]|nr:threonylcarbamoyl-AMP synthase [Chloroflexota bacterium]